MFYIFHFLVNCIENNLATPQTSYLDHHHKKPSSKIFQVSSAPAAAIHKRHNASGKNFASYFHLDHRSLDRESCKSAKNFATEILS
jgi:hypothetical protein